MYPTQVRISMSGLSDTEPWNVNDDARFFHLYLTVNVYGGRSPLRGARFDLALRTGNYKPTPMLVDLVFARRENGTLIRANLHSSQERRQGDRSMFSVWRVLVDRVFTPKNGPVPERRVNGDKEGFPRK